MSNVDKIRRQILIFKNEWRPVFRDRVKKIFERPTDRRTGGAFLNSLFLYSGLGHVDFDIVREVVIRRNQIILGYTKLAAENKREFEIL